MKKTLILLASIIALSCAKKKDDPEPMQTQTATVQPTTVTINLLDEIGNRLANVPIELYNHGTAMIVIDGDTSFGETLIKKGTSNSDGIYKTEIDANIQLAWKISAGGCMKQTSSRMVGKISPNVNNILNVVVKDNKGTIKISNTTSDPYYIYRDGTLWFTADAKASSTYSLPSNTYSIRVLQKSGYIIYATDATVSKTVTCGTQQTVTIN